MRRWETLTALAAVVLASVGSIPHVPGHIVLTAIAVFLIGIVGVSRLVAAFNAKSKRTATFDAAQRARTIREERNKRGS